jgi:hypothetical protein
MTSNQVYNLIILNESGSMSSIKQATMSGFNEVLQTVNSSLEESFRLVRQITMGAKAPRRKGSQTPYPHPPQKHEQRPLPY